MNELVSFASGIAEECGFEHNGPLNAPAVVLHEEVREMCASGKCIMYGKNWRCPPYCGTLDELREKMKPYTTGLIVQSTANLEDDFDAETMMETEQLHKKRFNALINKLYDEKPGIDMFPLSAGTCTLCPKCTCPDEPCRFPGKSFSSMEACGLNVSEVCKQSDIPYYYGKLTITYTSCILFP